MVGPFRGKAAGHVEEGSFGDVVGDLRLRVVDKVAGNRGDEDNTATLSLGDHVSM